VEQTFDLNGFRERSLRRGVNPVLYWVVRALFVPFFLVYFRLQRVGREHLPRSGPLLLASNHRSFLDPFVIGTLVRRPVYYMAKRELFEKRWQAWALNALGAFPVDRGDPKRGIGRLALETGAPVAPVAVIGSDAVRRGWRIRPRKVRIRVGRPLRFPSVESCSPALAAGVTERIWACVSLQWEWLGGEQAVSPVPIGDARGREISRAA
jgi:1-acyl-sn-glycerol-3-phosphate acyltransferase